MGSASSIFVSFETASADESSGNSREDLSRIKALTAQMKRGEEAAYREFFARYFGRILSYSIVLARGDLAMAEEIAQDALLRVVRHIKEFSNDDGFWNWLALLCRSAFLDHCRKRARYRRVLRFFAAEQESRSPADPEPGAMLEALEAALASLPAPNRQLIDLKYFSRKSAREIAELFQTTEKAVESQLTRARQKLRLEILKRLRAYE